MLSGITEQILQQELLFVSYSWEFSKISCFDSFWSVPSSQLRSMKDLQKMMLRELLVTLRLHLFYIGWIDGFAIFVAVFVVAMVGSVNDYKKEEQFIKLQAVSDKDKIVTFF
jgi:hypothetical protein